QRIRLASVIDVNFDPFEFESFEDGEGRRINLDPSADDIGKIRLGHFLDAGGIGDRVVSEDNQPKEHQQQEHDNPPQPSESRSKRMPRPPAAGDGISADAESGHNQRRNSFRNLASANLHTPAAARMASGA